MQKSNKINLLSFVQYFLFTFLVLFSITFFILFLIEQQTRVVRFEEVKSNELHLMQLEEDFLSKDITTVLSDLLYLRDAYKQQLQDPNNYAEIALNWEVFSSQRKAYDQIRFIDRSGEELIRINFAENDGYIVSAEKLQNKKDRYYFYETLALTENEIYISPLDLNIENGEIESPYKPMIRFSIPVYTDQGDLMGIIVLNYFAQHMLDDFRDLAQNSLGEIALLNADGYWLSSNDKTLEWHFMFDDQKDNTFQKKYESEWEIIKTKNGQIITPSGLFTFSGFNLYQTAAMKYESVLTNQSKTNHENWYIVSILMRDGKNSSVFVDKPSQILVDVIHSNPLYTVLILILSGIVSGSIYLNRKSFNIIKYYSEFDGLTNVYNRRAGLSKIYQLFSTNDQRKQHASLCFIDINGLKQVNDTLGHKVGDDLLQSTINIIKNAIREDDFIIRLGGDEFLIVHINASTAQAEEIWIRITDSFAVFNRTKKKPYLISVSHGIINLSNFEKNQIDNIIKLADEKMYEEKREMKKDLNVIVG